MMFIASSPEIDYEMRMKIRDIVIVLGLLAAAAALFFWPEGETEPGKDSGSEVTRSESGRTRSAGGAGRAGEGGKTSATRSDRVLRDQAKIIVTTDSGLQYEVLTEGSGERPTLLSNVKVHYVGTLLDGTVFDSSRDRGAPAVFGLHGVIKGWGEGLQLMTPGSTYRFIIPPNLAYGSKGAGDSIPADATLEFEVELISIEE